MRQKYVFTLKRVHEIFENNSEMKLLQKNIERIEFEIKFYRTI